MPRPRNPRALTRLVARNHLEGLPCRTARNRGVCSPRQPCRPQLHACARRSCYSKSCKTSASLSRRQRLSARAVPSN
ncbi:MAG: hypothetical protein ACK55Z_23760, partial [bacterium]